MRAPRIRSVCLLMLAAASLCGCVGRGARVGGGAAPRPRALLLQQSSAGDHRLTLFALREAGFEATWVNKESAAQFPATAQALRERFDVVFFGSLSLEGGLDKVLSAGQLAALKGFVAEGGGLVTVIGEAGSTLAELLPIVPGPSAGPMDFTPAVVVRRHPAVAGLPSGWPTFGSRYNSFGKVAARPGAQVLAEVPARYAGKAYPLLVAGTHGKGRVVCLNTLWAFSTGRHFKHWEWAPAFFAQTGRWAAGLPPIPPKDLAPITDRLWFWRYGRETIPDAAERVNKPVLTPIGPPPPGRVQLRLGDPAPTRILTVSTPPVVRETEGAIEVTFGNRMVARIDKRGMVGYRAADGLVLAEDPIDDTPSILHSGTTQPTVTKSEGGESFVLAEALPTPKAGKQAFRYVRHAIRDGGLDVTFAVSVNGQPEGELLWRFVPRTQQVDGVEWRGVGESMTLTSPRLFVEHILPRHRWAIGGKVEGHHTFRSGCYSQPRGYGAVSFRDDTSQDAGHFRWFSSGQPFQMLGSAAGTLWCYADTPALVASWLHNQAGSGCIRMVNKITVGRRRGRVEVPTLWYMFARRRMDRNLWMGAYDALRAKYRAQFGIRPMAPRPTAMMRFHAMGFVDLHRWTDALIPLAQRLGFKRVDCGVCFVHDTFNPSHGGLEALKCLCDRAHAAGIEVIFYSGTAWAKASFPPLKAHPEWIIRGRDGKPRPTSYPNLWATSLRSGWWDFSLGRYAELRRRTGIDAMWLDSWTMPNEFVNYAEPDARPTVVEALRYVKAIQDLGYTTLIEGQSPAGIDSFWYRHDRYADLRGNEFCLFNTTPFAYAGNGLFHLDLFRLLSYNCAMFQDPRLLANPADKITQVASHCNHLMNRVHDTIGFPHRVRETAFGTQWEAERGYALFAHQSRHVDISLPSGTYAAEAVDSPHTLIVKRGNDGRTHVVGTLMARGVLLIARRNE